VGDTNGLPGLSDHAPRDRFPAAVPSVRPGVSAQAIGIENVLYLMRMLQPPRYSSFSIHPPSEHTKIQKDTTLRQM
jgi:hypothetical protein